MHEDLPNNAGYVHHYTAEILSVQEQYLARHNAVKEGAFGMNMPGRSFSVEDYRYGFNGKENQDELMANNNSQDFGARMYDARVGRCWGMDYMKAKTPGVSPFVAMANNPILFVDPDGKENIVYIAFTETGYKNSFSDGFDYLKAMKELEDALNEILGKDHQVQVKFLPDEELSQSYLDESDAVIVLGPVDEVKKVGKEFLDGYNPFEKWKGSCDRSNPTPEKAHVNFVGVDTKVDCFRKFSSIGKCGPGSALVFVMAHGLGHTAVDGNHPDEGENEWTATSENQSLMNSGNTTIKNIENGNLKNLTQALKDPGNKNLRTDYIKRFKSTKPQDNYKINKASKTWKSPVKTKVKTRVKF